MKYLQLISLLLGVAMCLTIPTYRPINPDKTKRQTETVTEMIPSWIGVVTIENKQFRVVLDTGSGTLAVKGSGCSACVATGGSIYDPAAGNPSYFGCGSQCPNGRGVCQNNQCLITTTYLDTSSWSGLALNETMSIAGVSARASMVYFANASDSFLNDYSDGIIGLGYPPLGFPSSPIQNLLLNNGLSNIFWLGFNVDGSGVMTLGDANPAYYTGSLQYINVLPYSGSTYVYYQVAPSSMTLGSTTIASQSTLSPLLVIVDSGTTQLAVPTSIYNSITNVFQTSYTNAQCYTSFSRQRTCQMTKNGFNQWPNMTVSFANNVLVTITPQDYIQPVGGGYFQLGLGSLGNSNQILLGDPFMTGKYIGFDRVNHRLAIGMSSGITATSTFTMKTSEMTSTGTKTTSTDGTSNTSTTGSTQDTTSSGGGSNTQTSNGFTSTSTSVSDSFTGEIASSAYKMTIPMMLMMSILI